MVLLGSPMCRIGATIAAHISDAVVRSLHRWNRRDGICDPGISNGLGVRVIAERIFAIGTSPK